MICKNPLCQRLLAAANQSDSDLKNLRVAKKMAEREGFDEERSDEVRSAKLDARDRFCDEVPERFCRAVRGTVSAEVTRRSKSAEATLIKKSLARRAE